MASTSKSSTRTRTAKPAGLSGSSWVTTKHIGVGDSVARGTATKILDEKFQAVTAKSIAPNGVVTLTLKGGSTIKLGAAGKLHVITSTKPAAKVSTAHKSTRKRPLGKLAEPAAKRGSMAKGTSARHNAAANSDTAHTVAATVREAREAAGLSKAELAEKMATSAGAVARIEDARTNCTAATLANVAQALGCSLVISFARKGAK